MYDQLAEPFFSLLSTLFGFEAGTVDFYIVFGVTVLALLAVARLLVGLFGSEAGIFATALGLAAPLLFAFGTYIAIEVYALPNIEAEWAILYLRWGGFGFVLLLILLGFSSQLWDLGWFLTLCVFLLAAGAAYISLYGTHQIIKLVNQGSDQIEEHMEVLEQDLKVIE